MEIEISDIVVSLNGRDGGKRFLVVDMISDEKYAYSMLADGKNRRAEKPKRKKTKHVKLEQKICGRTAIKLRNGEKVTNSEIRRTLAEHAAGTAEKEGVC